MDAGQIGADFDRYLAASNYQTFPVYRHLMPFGRLAMRFFFGLFAPRLKMTGRHNIPRRGPVIIAPNHLSNADPALVLHGSVRPLWYMAKQELWEMPWLASVLPAMHTFPVDQQGVDRAALQRSEALLQHGQGLVIFPEGHCSENGQLGEIQPGASLLALRTGAPVLPVGIWGTDLIVPFAGMIPRPTLAPVHIHYGKLIHFDDLAQLPRREQRKAATERLEQALHKVMSIVRE
ncbi:MAG: 1-acyl-sn-glycerol-3-phosphate acyltransferase [Abitibacteriaceae bacterium]|nr:1-acyl-sn-glycerol-3-phosphate acyltransferase [Abditibacteriaceae bacterium]MBV9864023.1 1-acyl-sn-glycerol-3-phosphate acyltransferase [Abditibacteriaceae bacterium]